MSYLHQEDRESVTRQMVECECEVREVLSRYNAMLSVDAAGRPCVSPVDHQGQLFVPVCQPVVTPRMVVSIQRQLREMSRAL